MVHVRKRTAILVSGRGSNMVRLIEAAREPDYPAEISLVAANRPDAPALAIAQAANIPVWSQDSRTYQACPAEFDTALEAALAAHGIDLVCLAGFMRRLGPAFCARWAGRALNIHPSLLPSFPGLDTHAAALAAGVKLHGCTVHVVSAELDRGPIVAQAAVPVFDDDTPERLAARVLAAEHRLYPRVLRLLAAGALRIEGHRVLGADHAAEVARCVPST